MIPAFLVVGYYLFALHQQREREVRAVALQYAQLASFEMERLVAGAQAVLEAIAHTDSVKQFQACDRYLADLNARLPQFLAFAVADREGTVRCASEPLPSRLTVDDRPYFTKALEGGGMVVGEFTRSKIDDRRSLPLALPVRNGEVVTGVAITALNLEWLQQRLRERDLPEGSSYTVADRYGVIIAREPFSEQFIGSSIPEEFQYLVQALTPGTVEVLSQDGTRRVLGYYPPAFNGSDLYVSVGLSTEAAFSATDQATYRSIAVALLSALAVFAIAWLAGERLFHQPIARLLKTIAAWRQGDHSARTGIKRNGSELAALAGAIDDYMDELVVGKMAQQQAEEHRNLLVKELDHRVKNMLATVQAIASQTFRDGPREGLHAFMARLAALAAAHDMLMSENWARADLRKTIEQAVAPFDDQGRGRFVLSGPFLVIRSKAAMALSLALHELSTNAAKYGALTSDTGRVLITWSVEAQPDGHMFLLSWSERDGPAVKAPQKTGFGTRMIQKALASELSAEVDLDYSPTGVSCVVRCQLSSVVAAEGVAVASKAA